MAGAVFQTALDKTSELELVTTGRRTGRESARPVWFVHEGSKLYLLPVTGSHSQWYRNVVATPQIRLAADGSVYPTTGAPVTDPAKVGQIVEDFRSKYGAQQVAAYYSNPDVAVEVELGSG